MLQCDTNGEHVITQSDIINENQVTVEEVIKEKTDEQKINETKLKYAKLRMSLNELYAFVVNDYKLNDEELEEFKIIATAIYECIKLEKLTLINALTITLEKLIGRVKKYSKYYSEYKKNILRFYK